MLRLFIAVELSDRQKREVFELQQRVKQYIDGARWVRFDGMHLTLKFLGDTDENQIGQISEALNKSSEPLKPFVLRYGGCGVFPGPQKARVLWLGVKEGAAQVIFLAENLEESLSECGFQKEKRPYHPHLTIGRLRNPPPKDMIMKYIESENTFLSSAVETPNVALFQSKLSPQGAEYTALYRKSFQH